MSQRENRKSMVLFIWGLSWGLGACAGTDGTAASSEEYYSPNGQGLRNHSIPTFEEFKAATINPNVDYELYIVEGDIGIQSEEILRAYYDVHIAGTADKSAVHLYFDSFSLTNQWDRWQNYDQLGLTYCVSNDFGDKAKVVAAMAGAASNWASQANVWYRYDPTADGSCSQSDPLPSGYTFKVSPWTTETACSFFPHERSATGCVPYSVVYTGSAVDGVGSDNSLEDVTKVLTHELGHTLGLSHENQRADYATGSCVDSSMTYLTNFDPDSIMVGGKDSNMNPCPKASDPSRPSYLDGVGLRTLYGIQPAWYLPGFSIQ